MVDDIASSSLLLFSFRSFPSSPDAVFESEEDDVWMLSWDQIPSSPFLLLFFWAATMMSRQKKVR